MSQARTDDFEVRRKHLSSLSEVELEQRFWSLTEKVVEPLIELAKTHTTPSIERSVLLRMGFSSLEAKTLVDKVIEKDLIGKGAGHIVYLAALKHKMALREAGLKLADGDPDLWQFIESYFREGRPI